MNDRAIGSLDCDPLKGRPHQALAGNAMAASAVDAEQLASMGHVTSQRQSRLAVGVETIHPEHPHQHHQSGGHGNHNQC